jgi:hypothetical protein
MVEHDVGIKSLDDAVDNVLEETRPFG